MIIIKDVGDANTVCINCNNHSGCSTDGDPNVGNDGVGPLSCGGSITD